MKQSEGMTRGSAWNWAAVLEHHADRFPDRTCIRFGEKIRTYSDMATGAAELAAGMSQAGLKSGDVIAVLAYNSDLFLELMFAVNHFGGVFMPLNWRLAPAELGYMLEHSGARALVTEEELLPSAAGAIEGQEGILRFSLDRLAGWTWVEDLCSGVRLPVAAVDTHGLQRLMYTSGTTSHPKGVMISHANLAWKNAAHVAEFSVTAGDVGLVVGPLYHVGALDLTATTMLCAGASLIIHRKFDPSQAVMSMEQDGVTNVWLAPAMVNQIVNLPGVDDRDLSSVRFIIDGGEKMPLPLIERVLELFPNAWFADAYGLTETVSGDTFLDKRQCMEKPGSVGKPCLFLELEVWDDDGNPVPPGTPGEIVLRGPKVFEGYWQNPEATKEAFRKGWFHTGDIGLLDQDGFLFIVDRKKDMIISGGENVASLEVERVLYEHPAVLEAAVVARPDKQWGEVPVAFVATRKDRVMDAEDLIAHCRARLASFKCPKDVLLVRELPRNPSGKVLKRELRERLAPETERTR